jgi:PIN domain nuclease of toxin-antitoxin system
MPPLPASVIREEDADGRESRISAEVHFEPRRLRRALLDNGWRELTISSEHALATRDLPAIHKDPFDRIPSDEIVARYPGPVRTL